MKVKELKEKLIEGATEIWKNTSDNVIVGDENAEIKKLAVCFNLTAKILDDVIAWGADTVLTHEGVFGSRLCAELKKYDKTYKELTAENAELEKKLTSASRESIQRKLEIGRKLSELDELRRLVDGIPQEILAAYRNAMTHEKLR